MGDLKEKKKSHNNKKKKKKKERKPKFLPDDTVNVADSDSELLS